MEYLLREVLTMELIWLRYFMVVMEQLNFTKAAKIAFTSQSNISKQVLQLEQELGVQLFERLNIGVQPTPAGNFLYKGLSEILPSLDNLINNTKDIDICRRGTIRLGVCESMDIERIVPGLINKLSMHDLQIEIRIEAYSFDLLLEKLSLNELDMIFFFSVLKVGIKDVQRLPLNRENPVIYFSKNHPLYQKKDLKIEDFKDETFVRYSHKAQWYDQYQVLPFTPPKIIEANSLNTAFLYVESCASVAVFGKSQSYLGKDSIATLEIPTEDQQVGTDAIWLNNNTNPSLECFINFLSECYCRKSPFEKSP